MKRQSNRRDFIKRSALTAALLPVSPTIAAGETKARPFAQPQNFKKIKGRGTPDRIPKWNTDSTIIDSIMVEKMGNIGIGTPMPGEKIHLGDGNFLIEGGGETAIKIKRDFTITGKSGESPFPIFEFGRITQAGDGDPELVFFYSDDIIRSNPDMNKREVKILEVDRKGILASVKPVLEGKSRDDSTGSHFEGFIAKEVEPLFRLNSGPNPDQPGSGPRMRLEMGPGGSTPVDVAVQREAAATMTFRTGTAERVRIDGNGNVGIGTTNPSARLHVEGNLIATGTKTAAVPLSDKRVVSLYAVESPENWFEDFGSSKLISGEAYVKIDPTFAQTVNAEIGYHIFLTPIGDSKGLYVARKTPTGFEVREQQGGKSSIAFDYRIVAKRKGYENLRLQELPKNSESREANKRAATKDV